MGMEHCCCLRRQEVKARGRRGLRQCSRRRKSPSLNAERSWACTKVGMAWVWCLSWCSGGCGFGGGCAGDEGDEGSPQGHASDTPRTHKEERTDAQDGRHKIQTGMCGALVPLVVLPCPLCLPLYRSPLHRRQWGLVVRVPPPGAFFLSNQGRRMGSEKVARPLKRTGLAC